MDEKEVRTDIVIVDAERRAVRLEGVALTGVNTLPRALRAAVRERLRLDAVLLHDGGLSLGEPHAPVLMEASERLPADTTSWRQPAHARPWQQLGWFAQATRWLEQNLRARGEYLQGDVRQVSLSDLVCVLYVNTDRGGVYFKASETAFEAVVTSYLANTYPDLTPKVLVHDDARGWLVTRDGGARLSASARLQDWTDALEKLARFQRASGRVGVEGAFGHLGCAVYPFAELFEQASAFFDDEETLAAWGLREEQLGRLKHLLPTLRDAHRRVQALELPLARAHGDAQPMNALYRNARWFDWSEASVAHPFTDVGWCLAWTLNPARKLPLLRAYPDAPARLWRNYLRALGVHGVSHLDVDALRRDAMRLALAHRALVCHREYADFKSTVSGWRPQYVPYYLKLLLSV